MTILRAGNSTAMSSSLSGSENLCLDFLYIDVPVWNVVIVPSYWATA
jgi:hypothetical protein